jgi:hypothetical protein
MLVEPSCLHRALYAHSRYLTILNAVLFQAKDGSTA